jgi:hypothetical protein
MIALVIAAMLAQEEDPALRVGKDLDRIIGAFAGREEKFTIGAAGECLRLARVAGQEVGRAGAPAAEAAVYAAALDRISRAIGALENRPSELRRIQNHLERGRKRAAAIEDGAKKAAALRYAIDRASLVFSGEASGVADLVNTALDCLRNGAPAEAEDALVEAEAKLPALRASTLEASPEAPRMAAILLSRARAAQGRLREAADDLRRGIGLLPTWLDRELDFKEALHAKPEDHAKFVKALEAKAAEDADALLLLGHERFFSPEERAASREIFEKVLKRRPDDAAAKKFLEKLNQ